MKFSTRIDTDLSPTDLFDLVADFPRLERILMRRGVSVQRAHPDGPSGPGWDLGFDWRGKPRQMRMQVVHLERPERLSLSGVSDAFDSTVDFTVVALSRSRARLICEIELRPRSMRARLVLQTAKLGKAQLDRRFERRIADFVEELRRAA